MPNDADAPALIRALIERGHLDQVVICTTSAIARGSSRFGGHGYGHIFGNVVPLMRRRGFAEREIDAILVGNPRRLLTIA